MLDAGCWMLGAGSWMLDAFPSPPGEGQGWGGWLLDACEWQIANGENRKTNLLQRQFLHQIVAGFEFHRFRERYLIAELARRL